MAQVDGLNLSSVGKSLRIETSRATNAALCFGQITRQSGSQRVRHVCKGEQAVSASMQEDKRAELRPWAGEVRAERASEVKPTAFVIQER